MENFKVGTMNKFCSCYNKCEKLLFGYQRSYSVTASDRPKFGFGFGYGAETDLT